MFLSSVASCLGLVSVCSCPAAPQTMYGEGEGARNGQPAVQSCDKQHSTRGYASATRGVSRLPEHGGAPGGLGATGLQRIVEAIIEKEKPLVVHNGHLDLLHLFDKFIGKAPDTLSEFCKESLR